MSSNGGWCGHVERRVAHHATGKDWVQWAREAVTIIAAAGAAYMGIRVDLARNQMDIDNLKVQQSKIELQVEKIREMRGAAEASRR